MYANTTRSCVFVRFENGNATRKLFIIRASLNARARLTTTTTIVGDTGGTGGREEWGLRGSRGVPGLSGGGAPLSHTYRINVFVSKLLFANSICPVPKYVCCESYGLPNFPSDDDVSI